MHKLFYPSLAASNIKKNYRTYVPFILTCIGTIMMYYIMYALMENYDLFMSDKSLGFILELGTQVIAIFAVIFLFYTNSFLVKRRKKELGLLNILGMEKKHISRMMAIETLYVAVTSLCLGVLSGVVFQKLICLLLAKLLKIKITMPFALSFPALWHTFVLFGIIFVIILLNTLRQIHLSKPIELLKGGQTGEREPKTKWIMAILGAGCLGWGYYIALTTKSPLAAMTMFFLAVILVIIGTYFLFISGSIAVLKLLRKNKNYYYKTKHFTSISGMLYRMKQNAAGLASICILSTMVLVMVSTTVSLYAGMNDVLRCRYPRNVIAEGKNISDEQAFKLDSAIEQECKRENASINDVIRYRSMTFTVMEKGNSFMVPEDEDSVRVSNLSQLICITLNEYNKLEGLNETLDKNQVLVYELNGNINGDTLKVGDLELNIKKKLNSFAIGSEQMALLIHSYFIVVPEKTDIDNMFKSLSKGQGTMGELSYYYGFDTNLKDDSQTALAKEVREKLHEITDSVRVDSADAEKASFYTLYGGLLFLGIFLGLLFIMATVLIIYYKQISEGFDDRERFEIMQKVGMSKAEVKKSIHSQVLTVFFLPLVAAAIHIGFAFKFICRMLKVLFLTNVTLFGWCTVGCIVVFAIFYSIIYMLTARTYYRIVSQ